MMYRIKTFSKEEYFIPEEEFKAVMRDRATGMTFFPSLGGAINISSSESILPSTKIDKKDLSAGRLHDGSRVVKKFGTWVDADNNDVSINPSYYPEVAQDKVWSEEEYQAVKNLSTEEKKRLILGEAKPKVLTGGSGLTPVAETISKEELQNYGIKPN